MTVPVQVRTEPPDPEDVRATYGFVALLAEEVPEIGDLMQQAVDENWTADRFSMALAATDWWQSTPDGQRQWLVKTIADPATAEQAMQNGAQQVYAWASATGVPVPSVKQARKLWLETQVKGMDAAMASAHVARSLLADKNVPLDGVGGQLGKAINDMYDMSFRYGYIPPDLNDQIQALARNIVGNGSVGNIEGWRSKLTEYAAAKYTAFADRIRGGETVMDVARPYMESYARTLELNPADLQLNDRLIQEALQGNTQGAAKSVWQFEQDLRKDDRWGFTDNAKDSAGKTLTSIGKAFGMIG
ncbi:hypothetical protein [Umezawaea sp. NPDC059074]|uniref:hypothetical protein n=1 Tax=Umezawaea sp. NPDC059074 TaxID=3346716 RepID=UPI0036BF381E